MPSGIPGLADLEWIKGEAPAKGKKFVLPAPPVDF